MEINLGTGCVIIRKYKKDGKKGILLQQDCEPHDIGKPPFLGMKEKGYHPNRGDVIIWINDNLESLRVLQDIVNICVFEERGREVVFKE